MDNAIPSPVPTSAAASQQHDLKIALKAFKKRLKVTRLDNESGKSKGPFSTGKHSFIACITPPSQFPREVWEELVKQGKLTDEGNGMYQLVQGA